MQTKNCEIELKSVTEAGEFEGFAAVYDNVDLAGDAISPGAFSKTLAEGSTSLPLLWAHNQGEPIGRVELTDTPRGLLARGKLVLSVPKAREVYDLMKANVVKGLSIGFRAIKEQMTGGVRRLKEIRLFEVSLCVLAANPEAQVTAVKQQQDADAPDEALEAFRNAARDLSDFHRRMIEGD